MAGGHGAPANHEGRDVGAQDAHEHAGDDLVTVGDADDGVEAMGFDHGLHRVGDQFAAGEGEFHTGVAHGNAVTDSDGVEFEGDAARLADGFLDQIGDFIQVNVAGDDFVEGIANANEGFVEILGFDDAGGPEETAVWCVFGAFFNFVAIHERILSSVNEAEP